MALSGHRVGDVQDGERTAEMSDSAIPRLLTPGQNRRATSSLTERSPWNLRIHQVGVAGLAAFVAVVVAFHGLRGDLNPADHTISEYSLGRDGWLMRGAFLALGLGVVATALSVYLRWGVSPLLRTGVLLLTLSAFGLILDAAFNTDHPRVVETSDGRVHGIGMLVVCLTLPAASFLLGHVLRHTTHAASQARWVRLLGAAQLLAIVAFETGPSAGRGLIERTAIAMAITSLALLQVIGHSAFGKTSEVA